MMFPILISVSLAPGSYFFCALAAVAIAATETNDNNATRLALRNMRSSRWLAFRRLWQAAPALARTLVKTPLFRATKRVVARGQLCHERAPRSENRRSG